MSSAYQSMIDAALRNAQAMASTGVEKTASDNTNNFYKEASELANALEYMAISSVDDGTAAGVAQSDMIKDFFKQASKQRMGVPHGSTASVGTQGVAPSQGKLKLNQTMNNLVVSSGPNTTGNSMRESYKQASLYDILMGKQADSPAQYTSDQYLNISNANENSVRGVLDSNDSVAGFQRRDVHGSNIRARLAEAFSHTNDSLSDQTASTIFPQAYAAGGLKKTASATRGRLNKMAAGAAEGLKFLNTMGGRAAAGAGLGALAGGAGGYMAGGDAQSALLGAGLGAAGGAAAGGLMQRSAARASRAAKGEQLAAEQALSHVEGHDAATLQKQLEAQQAWAKANPDAPAQYLEQSAKNISEIERRLRGAKSLEGMTPEARKALMESEAFAGAGGSSGMLGMDAAKLEEMAIQRAQNSAAASEALRGGMGSQLGVAGGVAALGGLGAGMMAGGNKQASSPLSSRSRLRKMQRGL